MKSLKLALVPIAAAAMALSAPASANSLLFQGVTFETQTVDASEGIFRLTMLNADAASGNWSDANYLKAFEIKEIGDVTSATISSYSYSLVDAGTGTGGFSTNVEKGIDADTSIGHVNSGSGCTTGGTPGACFNAASAVALTQNMSWTIDFDGNNLNFNAPHLKVMFLNEAGDTSAAGSLLSQDIPAIPEPETYAMMMAGLGLMAFMARRRRNNGQGSLVPA